MLQSTASDPLFEFYRPYDPKCPDRKRDGECLEIMMNGEDDPYVEKNFIYNMSHGFFDHINSMRENYREMLAEDTL